MSTSTALIDVPSARRAVAIVTDEAMVRRRLQDTLRAAALHDADADHADVLLLVCESFRKPQAELVRGLRRRHPGAEVLVLSRSEDAAYVRLALEAGAGGLITIDEVDVALGAAIAAVCAGMLCLPVAYRRQMAKPTFTTREKQILALVVMGLSNGEIARQVYLAESTVKSHLSSAFTKLGVRSRNEATALILDPGSGLGAGILRITE